MQTASSNAASAVVLAPHAADSGALRTDDILIQSRLGVFAGLFYALRAKHPPTAAHGLRVALGCSKWAGWRKMPEQERHLFEVAALLHDVGKIGIPDHVLQKPARLDGKEQLVMEMHGDVGTEMLRGAGAGDKLLTLLKDSRSGFSENGENLLECARMLCIVDAFDSMTAEQVFRRAISRERAVDELFAHAGSQFDPELVHDFAAMLSEPRPELERELATRWLSQFTPLPTPGFWECDAPVSSGAVQNMVDTLFHRRLLNSLPDAAVYLDADGQVLLWNRAAERLTGRPALSLANLRWTADLMGLADEKGAPLAPEQCPFQAVLTSHAQFNTRMLVRHTDGRTFKVHFTGLPVFSGHGELSGIIMLIRDASAQANLEERVESLHRIASQDTLTKAANRAELERCLPEFVNQHLQSGRTGSLIICDIDHFKRINDTFGHQAGDEALVTFVSVLREVSRTGDLVARYGGEEFVVLCSGCDNPAATNRAEEIRRAVERTPVPAIGGNSLTASFGVTEIQPGDTGTTMMARADRALLIAKSNGRNRVVQLGAGQFPNHESPQPRDLCAKQTSSWLSWFRGSQEEAVVEAERLASVPHALARQKLEGFICDHKAEVLNSDDHHVTLRIASSRRVNNRRRGERAAVMLMDITIKPVDYRNPRNNTYQSKTQLQIAIRPVRARDRRSEALRSQAQHLLASFNSYLVTQEITDEMRESLAELR